MDIKTGDIVRVLAYGTKRPAANKENYWYVVGAKDQNIRIVNIAEAMHLPAGRKIASQEFHSSLVVRVK